MSPDVSRLGSLAMRVTRLQVLLDVPPLQCLHITYWGCRALNRGDDRCLFGLGDRVGTLAPDLG
jgi:hypothetical protein